MVIEEGFGDTLKKIGKSISKGISTVKNTYDYYSGKRSTPYNFAETAPLSVINKTDWKPFMHDGTKYLAKMDRDAGKVQIEVDARQVGKRAATLLNPKAEDKSLLKYLKGYDKSGKKLTLVMPINDKEIIKRLRNEEDFGQEIQTTDTTKNDTSNTK